MDKGEVVHVKDDDGHWVAVRLLASMGQGLANVLLTGRRVSDGQRVVVFWDGDLVEVPG